MLKLILALISLSGSLVYAIPYRPFDAVKMTEGLRADRAKFFGEVAVQGADEEEEFFKKTIVSKVLCQIDSQYANAACNELHAFYLSQKKIPQLLDFKVTRMTTHWLLKTLAKALQASLPVQTADESNRLQAALVVIGVAIAQNEALSAASAKKILDSLDRAKPWFQIFVLNDDFKPYLAFLEEAFEWIKIRPNYSVATLIAPYSEASISDQGLCFVTSPVAATCQIMGLSERNGGSTREFRTSQKDIVSSNVLLPNEKFNGAFLRSQLANVSLQFPAQDKYLQFSGNAELYCLFDGKNVTCGGRSQLPLLSPIDPSKIVQILASSDGAKPYKCLVYLSGFSSEMNCSEKSPFPAHLTDVSYVLGTSTHGCVVGLSGFRCFKNGVQTKKIEQVYNVALAPDETCIQPSVSAKWECEGKYTYSSNKTYLGANIERLTNEPQSTFVTIENRLIKFEQAEPTSLRELNKGLATHLRQMQKLAKIKTVIADEDRGFVLAEDGSFYTIGAGGRARIDQDTRLATVIDSQTRKEWPPNVDIVQSDMGVVSFPNVSCQITASSGCDKLKLQPPFPPFNEIRGFFSNGCYLSTKEFVCGDRKWPMANASLTSFRILEFPATLKQSRLPYLCFESQGADVCLSRSGDPVPLPIKKIAIDQIIVRNSYYCIPSQDKIYCSDGSKEPRFRLYGNFEKIYYARTRIVAQEGVHLTELANPGSDSEKVFESDYEVQQFWHLNDEAGDVFCFRSKKHFDCFGDVETRADFQLSSRGYETNANFKLDYIDKDGQREICVTLSKKDKVCTGKFGQTPYYRPASWQLASWAGLQTTRFPHYFIWGTVNETSIPSYIAWADLKIEGMFEESGYEKPCLRWSNGMTSCPNSSGVQVRTPKVTGAALERKLSTANLSCERKGDALTCSKGTEIATATFPGIKEIGIGNDHICVLYKDGLKCFGSIKANQFGPPQNANFGQADVPNDLGAIEWIIVGKRHTCAKVTSGLRCWGLWFESDEANVQ